MGSLDRRVTLITGGTSGIGRATALLFAQEGARVALVGRDGARGNEVVAEIEAAGGTATFLSCDVRLARDCRWAVEQTVQTFGRLDLLVNNAGVFYPNTVLDCTEEEWDLTLDTNLKGTYLMCRFALRAMIAQGGGVIVNNASDWGLVGGGEAAAYCASKGGVVLLTKAMAIDHARHGIRVNCVCPGEVETPMLVQEAQRLDTPWEDYLAAAADCPLGRVGQPEEIARAILFLASEDSSYMTGATLVIDGGNTAR